MPRTASVYERELKGVLQGEPVALRRYGRLASTMEDLERLRRLQERPFLVVRAAGSFGFDLVALRDRLILPVEVKSSTQETIHFAAASGRAQAQFRALRAQTLRAQLPLFYAFRRIGGPHMDPWRIFQADGGPTEGLWRLLGRHVPRVEVTSRGNQILRWERGEPLLKFIDWSLQVTGGS
jgi:hypothetical protein